MEPEPRLGLPHPATVLVELGDPADRVALGHPVSWLDAAGPSGTALERAVREHPLPPGRGQVWVAGEAAVIRRVRSGLLQALDRGQVTTRGYWRQGESNHPDHDYGDEA